MAVGLTCLKSAAPPAGLTQINRTTAASHRILRDPLGAKSMFDTGRMNDELDALKVDVSRLLNATGEETFDASKSRAEALADQIKAALGELGETVAEEREQLHAIVAERPIASLASAFALGVAIGFMLRRH